jgi:hypothetical protein
LRGFPRSKAAGVQCVGGQLALQSREVVAECSLCHCLPVAVGRQCRDLHPQARESQQITDREVGGSDCFEWFLLEFADVGDVERREERASRGDLQRQLVRNTICLEHLQMVGDR